MLLGLLGSATCAHAGKVITVGDLADATSARVLAKAMEARALASKAPDGDSQVAGVAHPNMGGAPKPMILNVTTAGIRQYATIRMPDGSAQQVTVGQATEDGLVVRSAAGGGFELLDASGTVTSSFGRPSAEALPPVAAPRAVELSPPPGAPPLDLNSLPSSKPASGPGRVGQ